MSIVDPLYIAGILISIALAALAIWITFKRRLTADEKERRRRVFLNRGRRTAEGFITEAGEELIHYHYELRGVTYFASQDVTGLRQCLPEDPSRLIGSVSVKYDPKNPANSIVVCEDWSGLPNQKEGNHAT